MAIPFDIFSEHAILKHKAREITTSQGSDVQTELDFLRGQLHWLSPVPRVDLLPQTGNQIGDARLTEFSREVYLWLDIVPGWQLDWRRPGYGTGTAYLEQLDTTNSGYIFPDLNFHGHLLPKYSESYTFELAISPSSDFELQINGVSIAGTSIGSTTNISGLFIAHYDFTFGQFYDINLIYQPHTPGVTTAVLKWSSLSQPVKVIDRSDIVYSVTPQWLPLQIDLTRVNDFSLTNLQPGDILKYNGNKWVNEPGTLENVNDVNTTNLTQHDLLLYNSSTQKWINLPNNLDNMVDTKMIDPRNPHQLLEYNGNKWTNIDPIPPQHFYLKGVINDLIQGGHSVNPGYYVPAGSGTIGDGNPEPGFWVPVRDLTQVVCFVSDTGTALFRWSLTATETDLTDGYDVYCALFIDDVEVPNTRSNFVSPLSVNKTASIHVLTGQVAYPITRGEHLVEVRINVRIASASAGLEGAVRLVGVDRSFLVAELGGTVNGTTTGGGATALSQLTDVAVTTPSVGQILKYDGTKWVNDAAFSRPKASALGTTATPQTINTDSYVLMQDMSINFNALENAVLRIQWSVQLHLTDPHLVRVSVFIDGSEVSGAYRIGGLSSTSGLNTSLDVNLNGLTETTVTSGLHVIELRWHNELGHTASTVELSRCLLLEDVGGSIGSFFIG